MIGRLLLSPRRFAAVLGASSVGSALDNGDGCRLWPRFSGVSAQIGCAAALWMTAIGMALAGSGTSQKTTTDPELPADSAEGNPGSTQVALYEGGGGGVPPPP